MLRYLLLGLTLCLGACALPKADPAREAQADWAYELVRGNDVEGLKAIAGPSLQELDLRGPLGQMQGHLHPSAPTKAVTVSWLSDRVNQTARYQVIRLYSHPEGDVQFQALMMREGDGDWRIDGVHVSRVTAANVRAYEAQLAAARFTLIGKSPAHYIVLIGAGLSFLLCVGTALVAGLRRRWLWMLGSLFGIGQVTLNWTTGAFFVQPIYFVLLGAGVLKGPVPTDPWMIMLGLPIPALLFWGLGKWRPKAPKAKAEAARAEPDAWTPDA